MSEENKKELSILKYTIISYGVINVIVYSVWLFVDYFIHGEYGPLLSGIFELVLIGAIYKAAKDYHNNSLF
jgi:hypothetical protein